MSNNNKVKGLLKGLRFISQIFDTDEKDSEIQISNPTDVKHVAHIGWDGHGPSENTPSWMNEFQSVPGNSSAPQTLNGDIHSKRSGNSVQMTSQDSMERGSRSGHSQGREKDSREFPKPSKRQTNSMGNIRESHAKEKSDRSRPPKNSSKPNSHPNDPCNGDTDSLKQQQQGSDLPPKKSRPKMSKDGSNVGGGSSKSRTKPHHHHHHSRDSNSNNKEVHARHSSKSRSKHGSFEEDAQTRNKHGSFEEEEGQFQRRSSENILKSYPN